MVLTAPAWLRAAQLWRAGGTFRSCVKRRAQKREDRGAGGAEPTELTAVGHPKSLDPTTALCLGKCWRPRLVEALQEL